MDKVARERIKEAYRTGGCETGREAVLAERTRPPGGPGAKCPTCGSEKIQRISANGKVMKIATLGPFGLGDVHKIFRCLNCGYKW